MHALVALASLGALGHAEPPEFVGAVRNYLNHADDYPPVPSLSAAVGEYVPREC